MIIHADYVVRNTNGEKGKGAYLPIKIVTANVFSAFEFFKETVGNIGICVTSCGNKYETDSNSMW